MGPPTKKTRYHNKRANYFLPQKRHFLEVGQKGFLATCNFREKDCVRECYNILNQYADEMFEAEPREDVTTDEAKPLVEDTKENAPEPEDIADELQKQIEAATAKKNPDGSKIIKQHRFQAVDTGATNCLFIRTTLEEPVELGTRIIMDIANTKKQRTRYLLRLIPIEAVCKANVTDIVNAAGAVFDRYFLKEGTTFAIVFNKRYNHDIQRDVIIRELADLVQSKNPGNRVDLKQAEYTVVVEIIKGLCCLGVVPKYLHYKKYNLIELANVKDGQAEANSDEGVDGDKDTEDEPKTEDDVDEKDKDDEKEEKEEKTGEANEKNED